MLSQILFLISLIFLNAFFASSEIALITLNDTKVRLLAEEGDKKYILLRNLLSEPSKFLATIQIGITLAGFLASAFASESFADNLVGLIAQFGFPVSVSTLKSISMIVIALILSYFTLVLGELVPKRLAMKKAEAISMFVVYPIRFISIISSPFVKLLTVSTNFVVRLFGVDPQANDKVVTEEEIRMMVDVGEEKGVIPKIEKVMINNVFEFDNKTVIDIMTHRTDIVSLPIDSTLKEIVDLINNKKFSRIPVYEENIDNIIGILYVKDLIKYLDDQSNKSVFNLKKVVRTPYYVPFSKKTNELFREMQKNKVHMAIIIDEYGGTAGIVTIEDLVEEIVGNILDEYDEEEENFEKLDENTYLISGACSLDDVNELLKANLPVEDYETLSGFVISQLGRIPGVEEKLEIEYNGIIFKVEQVDEKRIAKVKVCKAY